MFDPGVLNNRVSIKLSAGGSVYGTLPEVWGSVSTGLKNSADVLDLFENDVKKILTGLGNSQWLGLVDSNGLSVVDVSDSAVGLFVSQDALTKSYIYKTVGTSGDGRLLGLISESIMTSLEKYLSDVESISETQKLYDWGYTGNVIEPTVVAKSSNITGVTVTNASGNTGQYTLAYTAATKTLTFGGGVSQVAYIIPTTPTPYKMVLVAGDLTTKIDVVVSVDLLPSGNASDKIGIGVVEGTKIDQPATITGVTLVRPVGSVDTLTLVYTASGKTLTYGGGTPVDVTAGGYFILTDTAGNTVVALVDPTKLPSGNVTVTGLVIHRCIAANTANDLLINILV